MAENDKKRWDDRYRKNASPFEPPEPPSTFADLVDEFPTSGVALDVACGVGGASVWMAMTGLMVTGIDVSSVAIQRATRLAKDSGVGHRCSFSVADLDRGLPPGAAADVVLCHLFRDPELYPAMMDRLKPGGLLAIAVLSEVGAETGSFRASSGELLDAFDSLAVVASGEADGVAWLLGRSSV